MASPLRLATLLATTWLVACAAAAGDGDIRWQTLHAQHADVHFPAGYEPLARHVAATASDAHATLGPLFHVRSRPRLQVTIDDFSDDANGSASPLPYDLLHLQAYPPDPLGDLGDHGDWVRMLVFHEYAHLLHLGDVSGPPAAANQLLGRQFLPNAAMPRLLLEGVAIWAESHHTGADTAVQGRGGRIGSAQFGAMLRAAVLDGTVPLRLDALGGRPLVWPRGNGWYLYGSVLVDDLVAQHGLAKLRAFIGAFGRQVVPLGVQGLAREVWGASLQRLWQDARQRLIAAVWRQIAQTSGVDLALAPTRVQAAQAGDGTRLTHDGDWRGRIRMHPDGQTAWVARAPRDGLVRVERIRLADGQVDVLHTCALDCDEPLVTPDGRWLLLVASRRSGRLYLYRELVAVALDGSTDPLRRSDGLRVTQGLRLRSTSLDAKGARLAAVLVRGGQTALTLLDLPRALRDATAGRTIGEQDLAWVGPAAPLGTTVDAPVLAAGALWWTASQGGQRQLWRAPLDATGRPQQAQTVPVWLDGGDRWLPQQHPSRCGEPVAIGWLGDLQAVDTADGWRLAGLVQIGDRRDAAWWNPQTPQRPWQLRSRSAVGLYSAAHSAHGLATVRHQGRGLDVWRGPPDASPTGRAATAMPTVCTGAPHDRPAETPSGADVAAGNHAPASAAAKTGGSAAYRPAATTASLTPYHPWPSLRPRSWTPLWLATASGPPWLGASIGGRDAVGYLDWNLLGQVRTDGSAPVVVANAAIGRWEPLWAVGLAFDHSEAWFRRGFEWFKTPTARLGLRLGGAWSVPHLRSAWQTGAALRWTTTWLRETRYDQLIASDPAGPPPIDPLTGSEWIADAYIGYSDAERYPDSIAVEREQSATLRMAAATRPGLGLQRLTVQADGQLAWPLGQRHIVQVSGHGAVALLAGQDDALYRIRGIEPLQSWNLLGLGGTGSWTVRGAPLDTGLGGQGLAWGSLAWRMPLVDIGRTLELLPLYAGRLHGSLFVDGAWAFASAAAARTGGLWSAGAQMQLDIQLGYGLDGALRLGAAWLVPHGGGGWLSFGL